jgi:hypothetical protein
MESTEELRRRAADAMRANFALEGIQFTAEELALQEQIVRGEITTDEAIARIRKAFAAPHER